MSVENAEKFFRLLGEDKSLMERVKTAGAEFKNRVESDTSKQKGNLPEVHALLEPFAREVGCAFTLEELENYQKGPERELTNEELDAICGGGVCCFCVAGGAGQGLEGDLLACVIFGTTQTTAKHGLCCGCVLVGGGSRP